MGGPKRSGKGFGAAEPASRPKMLHAETSSELAAKELRSMQLIKQGKFQEAEAICRELITAGTTNYIIHANLGMLLKRRGEPASAIAAYQQALALNPRDPNLHYNLGNAFKSQGNLKLAIAAYTKALELNPADAESHYNLGNAHKSLDNLQAAIAAYRNVLELNQHHLGAHNNLAIALHAQGDLPAAIAAYRTLIELNPNYPDAKWNYALTLLLNGDYDHGWEHYEFRPRRNTAGAHGQPQGHRWDGTTADSGSDILLVSEQGIGDTLQFMRYVPILQNRGFSVTLSAPQRLHTLIQASGIAPSLINPDMISATSARCWSPLLSVPRHLGVRPGNPLLAEPYIASTDELESKWKDLLATEKRPVIGINWQGNPEAEQEELRGRSLPLEAFSPIIANNQVSLVSLQKGYGSEQLQSCSFRHRFVACQQQVDDTWDFLETAAIIANCDLIITSDTSVAHLAGGMGKTTWLLLHNVPDWRWGLDGDATFWYPSMRLFRQTERGNWDDVLRRVADSLHKQLLRET